MSLGSWDDIRAPIVTIPASQLNPRLNKSLVQLRPLLACLAAEALVQLWQSSVETIMVSECVAVCCSVLQCVAVCCSVLQCVAVCCSVSLCGRGAGGAVAVVCGDDHCY